MAAKRRSNDEAAPNDKGKSRAPAGRRRQDPQRSDASAAGRFGGYGQAGYGEEAAAEPGVQMDFDEEENREEPSAPGDSTARDSRTSKRTKNTES
jgi:hypothetical protein